MKRSRKKQKSPSDLHLQALLSEFERISEKLDVPVHYDNITKVRSEGGLCRIAGKHTIVLNRKLPIKQRIHLLANCLQELDLDQIYLPPMMREFFDDRTFSITRKINRLIRSYRETTQPPPH